MAASSISGTLALHLYHCLDLGLEDQRRAVVVRHGINGFADSAYAAYPVAVAAWEAFLFETPLSSMAKAVFPSVPLWLLPDDMVDRWRILMKTELLPKLLLGTSFDKGAQPLQDFQLLVDIRNAVTHFKFSDKSPKAVIDLSQRGVFLNAPKAPVADYPWMVKIACTEGIRWSINTLAAMAAELVRLADGRKPLVVHLATAFRSISREWVEDWYAEAKIDHRSDFPLQVQPTSPESSEGV